MSQQNQEPFSAGDARYVLSWSGVWTLLVFLYFKPWRFDGRWPSFEAWLLLLPLWAWAGIAIWSWRTGKALEKSVQMLRGAVLLIVLFWTGSCLSSEFYYPDIDRIPDRYAGLWNGELGDYVLNIQIGARSIQIEGDPSFSGSCSTSRIRTYATERLGWVTKDVGILAYCSADWPEFVRFRVESEDGFDSLWIDWGTWEEDYPVGTVAYRSAQARPDSGRTESMMGSRHRQSTQSPAARVRLLAE